MFKRFWFPAHYWRIIFLGLGLSGCAAYPSTPLSFEPAHPETAHCLAVYRALDREAEATNTIDVRHVRVPGTPLLRTSRFWAGFDPGSMNSTAYSAWLEHQNALAIEGLTLEWLRLSEAQRRSLKPRLPEAQRDVIQVLTDCGEQLVHELTTLPPIRRIEVKDSYQSWKRWLGFYPLAALPFYRGVIEEQHELSERQAQFTENLPTVKANRWRFFDSQSAVPSPADALTRLSQQPLDPLGVPIFDGTLQRQLLSAFQPTVAVQAINGKLAENDRPLRLSVNDEGQLLQDSSRPTLYTDVTYGRYRDQVTIQLSYSVWFSERRPEGVLDLLAGRYNGVTWRVHLLPTGAVIGFDKMHLCGCWYQFFPAMGFRPRPDLPFTQEPFHLGKSIDPRERQTLWLASNTHHLLGVSAQPGTPSGASMEVRAFDDLRAIGHTGTDHHFTPFNEEGLLPESRRLERWVFWPMGIRSPGALRLFGTHAIAFIGRRHFDDPGLLEELGL